MTFFTAVAGAVTEQGKRINIEVVGAGEGRIRVIISPDIGQVPEGASDEVAKVYALMARPLLTVGTPEEVEAGLTRKLGQMSAVLAEGESALAALRQIKEQAATQAKAGAGKTSPQPQVDADADAYGDVDADLDVVQAEAVAEPAVPQGGSIGESF